MEGLSPLPDGRALPARAIDTSLRVPIVVAGPLFYVPVLSALPAIPCTIDRLAPKPALIDGKPPGRGADNRNANPRRDAISQTSRLLPVIRTGQIDGSQHEDAERPVKKRRI